MKNCILIFGGKSFEHDISIITALIIYKNCKHNDKFRFLPVYIDKNNDFYYYTKDDLDIKVFKNFEENKFKVGFKKAFFKTGEQSLFYKGITTKKIHVSCALNCCHGGIGESGDLVSYLQLCNIPTSSTSPLGMQICMDKIASKYFFKGAKLPVIDFFTFTKKEYKDKEQVISRAKKLGFPLILKPCTLGSSIGIKIANDANELEEAIEVALSFDNKILVEKVIEDMDEYNVACVRLNDEIIVSPVDKVVKSDNILSFEDKYVKGEKKGKKGAFLAPKKFEKINAKLEERLKALAKKTYELLELGGVVRIDFIVKKQKIYVNEVNTVPGSLGYYFFCPTPFKTMPDFVDSMLSYATKQQKTRAQVKKEFVTKLI